MADRMTTAARERLVRENADLRARLAEVEAERDGEALTARAAVRQRDAAEARLVAVRGLCEGYPRTAKFPDFDGGYEFALDDVLALIDREGDRPECNCDDAECPECSARFAFHLTPCRNAAHEACPVWAGPPP